LFCVPRLICQAQTNLPTPPPEKTRKGDKHDNPPVVSVQIDADNSAGEGTGSLTPWLKTQADALLDVIHCYMDKESLQKEAEFEKKDNSPTHLIEVRIKLLKVLAQHNTASHCK